MRFFVTQLADWQGDGFADLDGKPLGEQPPTEQPEALIVTSSAEIGVLRSPRAQAILARAGAARIALHSFVSVGCAGVFAALFEARRLGVKSARILALEAPRAHVQARLDAAGLQYFEAQETACVMDLSCQPVGLALPIGHCEILARPDTMGGTAALAARIAQRLRQHQSAIPGLSVVDFENTSDWARGLAHLVRLHLPAPATGWLGSVETDRRHYMSARPILDLMRHHPDGPLLLGCLGAGGRLGICTVGHPAPLSPVARPECLTQASGPARPRALGAAIHRPRFLWP